MSSVILLFLFVPDQTTPKERLILFTSYTGKPFGLRFGKMKQNNFQDKRVHLCDLARPFTASYSERPARTEVSSRAYGLRPAKGLTMVDTSKSEDFAFGFSLKFLITSQDTPFFWTVGQARKVNVCSDLNLFFFFFFSSMVNNLIVDLLTKESHFWCTFFVSRIIY